MSDAIEEFVNMRNKALASFDILNIATYMFKCDSTSKATYKHMVCAASVCKALLEIPSMDKEIKERAAIWLKTYKFKTIHGDTL